MIKTLTIGRFYPPNHGGIERHIHELLQGIGQQIHADCIVFDNNQTTPAADDLNYHLYKVPMLTTIASTPIAPALLTTVKKLQAKNHYDILHLHLPNPIAQLATYLMPREVKLVLSWHSDIVRQKNLLQLYRPFLQQLINRADAIIAATPAHFTSSQQLKNYAHPERLQVIPYGIDVQSFANPEFINAAQTIRTKYPQQNIIFSIGRHVYYKGFEYLIRAMADIDNTILLLAGTGPLTPELKNLTSNLNLNNKIQFLGTLSDNELATYYQAADIFCLPSVEPSEAFGLVQIEAMACHKPVVCCELNNGVTYVNQHNVTGLVVPPRDPKGLAQALNSLIGNPALRLQLGEQAYQRLNIEFTQKNMWEKTLILYKKLLNNN